LTITKTVTRNQQKEQPTGEEDGVFEPDEIKKINPKKINRLTASSSRHSSYTSGLALGSSDFCSNLLNWLVFRCVCPAYEMRTYIPAGFDVRRPICLEDVEGMEQTGVVVH